MVSPIVSIPGGGVTSAAGFRAAGVAAGIKKGRNRDVALVVSDEPAEAAALFTTNQVKAAPVKVSMAHARSGKIRAIVANAGCANACTGIAGLRDAKETTEAVAAALGCKAREILVCSTGRIGVPLPMPALRRGVKAAAAKLDASPRTALKAAEAIMTTDTFAKHCAVRVEIDGHPVTIGGMAKGAGMIHPDMATMLCFLTTDARIERQALRRCLEDCAGQSFNRISVDGDTSTNDTVILLANGRARNAKLTRHHPQYSLFRQALRHVMRELARLIVEDGEGTSKVVEIIVKGAASAHDAQRAAVAVGTSTLVKCSWCGEDPNWGRIMDALGYSGAKVREEMVEIFYDGVQAAVNGQRSRVSPARLKKVVSRPRFAITIHLHLGPGEHTFLTTDLTEEYVTLNKGE
ncbi:MAG: bifunctional glutamate N-acetyltransferase/amino-acid acetyltransferase ArgJ [Verrucomicrobium sp.]|nr:bifunctional glutamate N-acetyltransferase/amino-acid acetyltransferase ArgJ [Verrucomicrobium sp.]